ncbi:MAG: hypothetical protein CMM87_00110 [Rickettsiales bacterium]|nr:hypothetical protein [Rickettsiales bacterium]|tara:strand:- start:1516 stop:3243 length:1728 start_codon:yes stop_codon:yes gene_type:complete
MKNFIVVTIISLLGLQASALTKAALPDHPALKNNNFVIRLMKALNGELPPKPKPDTTVRAQLALTPKPLQAQTYTFIAQNKNGQDVTVTIEGDRYELKHYLKTEIKNRLAQESTVDSATVNKLIREILKNSPVIFLGYSLKSVTGTKFVFVLKNLPLKMAKVQGPEGIATPSVVAMVENHLNNKPYITAYDVQNMVRTIQELPGYQGAEINFKPSQTKDSLILLLQLKKTEDHHIGYLFKNDLSDKVGPLNNSFSFTANNAFMDHDALKIYTVLSQEPKNLWGMGLDYNYLLTDSGIRHGFSVGRMNIDPEGLDANRNLSTKNANYATYFVFPLYQDLTDEVILTTILDHKRGSTNAPGLTIIRVLDDGGLNITNLNDTIKSIQTNFIANLKYNFKDTWGGKNGLTLNYVKGLGLTIDKARDRDRGNLSAWSILLGFTRKQDLGDGFAVTPSVDMQWASAKAGPNQNYAFGGRAIERAYKNHAVQGQSGVRAGLKVSYMDFIYAYYGYGRIKNHANNISTRKEEATATGVGVTIPLFQFILANVEYAIPLKRRTLYADGKHHNKLFVSVGGRWKF